MLGGQKSQRQDAPPIDASPVKPGQTVGWLAVLVIELLPA